MPSEKQASLPRPLTFTVLHSCSDKVPSSAITAKCDYALHMYNSVCNGCSQRTRTHPRSSMIRRSSLLLETLPARTEMTK